MKEILYIHMLYMIDISDFRIETYSHFKIVHKLFHIANMLLSMINIQGIMTTNHKASLHTHTHERTFICMHVCD